MYDYPTIQPIVQDTIFLMYETFLSGKYDWYSIPYRYRGVVLTGYISHQSLIERIANNQVKLLSKSDFSNGKIFIKIPLKYIKHDTRTMEETEGISNKLF
jgi:hypothetical protein